MKPIVILFQPYLRVHILNFGIGLRNFIFSVTTSEKHADTKTFYKTRVSSYQAEIIRNKITPFHRLRRIIALPNIRFRYETKGHLLFTYGCLLLTNKPYCVYIENGAALFNYDPKMLRNPFAKLSLIFFALQPQCKSLIFMSQAARRSFYSTLELSSGRLHDQLQKKSEQVYPLVRNPGTMAVKTFDGTLKLLFTGVYYMKGGVETLAAFKESRKRRSNITLTVVTPLHLLHPDDRQALTETEGVMILDAVLGKNEMATLYRTHDIFLFPTFRDTFGLVLIEALSFGLPIIALDQYAVTEMVQDGYNGFVLPDHPLTDYDRATLAMKGSLYNAKVFYARLLELQRTGKTRPITDFIVQSIESYLLYPGLITEHSKHSRELYDTVFDEKITNEKIETVFTNALL